MELILSITSFAVVVCVLILRLAPPLHTISLKALSKAVLAAAKLVWYLNKYDPLPLKITFCACGVVITSHMVHAVLHFFAVLDIGCALWVSILKRSNCIRNDEPWDLAFSSCACFYFYIPRACFARYLYLDFSICPACNLGFQRIYGCWACGVSVFKADNSFGSAKTATVNR